MLDWFKRNGLALILVIGVIVGAYIAIDNAQSAASDNKKATVDAVIAQRGACIRGSERTALNAAFQREAAKARAAVGDKAVAILYMGAANGAIAQVPARPDHRGDPRIAEVRLTYKTDARAHKRIPVLGLTNYAKRVQADGCMFVNPLPKG